MAMDAQPGACTQDGETSDARLFEEAIRKADEAMYEDKAVRRKDGRPPSD